MRFTQVSDWLDWQQRLHGRSIDLGLERSRAVASRLGLFNPTFTTISVSGTNGKGSCVAALESVLLAAGYRVGAYTSPHLLRYNERIRVDGEEVCDQQLLDAFHHVDVARVDTSSDLLRVWDTRGHGLLSAARTLDIVLLEVGLGGVWMRSMCLMPRSP